MSDRINHECGISFLHLKKPIEFYRKKYGTSLYGINKMYLLMENNIIEGKMEQVLQALNLICNQVKDT